MHNVTQAELARRLGVAQVTVSKFENARPTVATVRRYLEALGANLELTAVFDDERFPLRF